MSLCLSLCQYVYVVYVYVTIYVMTQCVSAYKL